MGKIQKLLSNLITKTAELTENEMKTKELLEYTAIGGKMIRSKISLQMCNLLGLDSEVALIVEILHAAILVFDDFIDKDVMRRGKESLYAKNGTTAIREGYFIMSLAYKMCPFDKEAYNLLSLTIFRLSLGVNLEINNFEKSEEIYSQIADFKTGSYTFLLPLGLPMVIKRKELEIVEKFSILCGRHFQMVDDLEDYYTGKLNKNNWFYYEMNESNEIFILKIFFDKLEIIEKEIFNLMNNQYLEIMKCCFDLILKNKNLTLLKYKR